jgi:hypothetical protein
MNRRVIARPADRGNAQYVKETSRRQKREIITQDEMRDLIQVEVEAAGNIPQMCRNLHMRSSTPVYLALQGERDISDNISLLFGFERTVMFKRIGHATRR